MKTLIAIALMLVSMTAFAKTKKKEAPTPAPIYDHIGKVWFWTDSGATHYDSSATVSVKGESHSAFCNTSGTSVNCTDTPGLTLTFVTLDDGNSKGMTGIQKAYVGVVGYHNSLDPAPLDDPFHTMDPLMDLMVSTQDASTKAVFNPDVKWNATPPDNPVCGKGTCPDNGVLVETTFHYRLATGLQQLDPSLGEQINSMVRVSKPLVCVPSTDKKEVCYTP
jgi:hypothetical protein